MNFLLVPYWLSCNFSKIPFCDWLPWATEECCSLIGQCHSSMTLSHAFFSTYLHTFKEYRHLLTFSWWSNIKMITVYDDSGYSSSDEEDCVPAFEFKLPNCTLPDFIDTPDKWSQCVYETNTLQLWCDLMLKIESYNPLYLSEYEVDKVVWCMAEDIIYMHGMTKFFPSDYCRDCGMVHSVSYLPSFFFGMFNAAEVLAASASLGWPINCKFPTVNCSTVSGSLNDFLHTKPGEGFSLARHYINYMPAVESTT